MPATWAARMDEQCGARVAQVVERSCLGRGAGHSSIRVTSDRYGHLFPPARQELADELEETYRNAASPAGPACGRYATSARLSTRGRLESLNRAFSGGCNYPVEDRPQARPRRSERREAWTGVSRPSRVGPQQRVMRRTNPGQVGSVLPHPRAYAHPPHVVDRGSGTSSHLRSTNEGTARHFSRDSRNALKGAPEVLICTRRIR
jgi:hypothetical protein